MSGKEESGYNVVVAIDHSSEAEKALRFFLKTLTRPNVNVVLLHCFDLSLTHADVQAASYEAWKDIVSQEKATGKALEDKFRNEFEENKVRYKFLMEASSNPGETIVEVAERTQAKYVMMGTRGLGLVRRTIFGSVSDFVLHHAPCPVFVYRE